MRKFTQKELDRMAREMQECFAPDTEMPEQIDDAPTVRGVICCDDDCTRCNPKE